MIDLNNHDDTGQPITEGIISDSIKDAAKNVAKGASNIVNRTTGMDFGKVYDKFNDNTVSGNDTLQAGLDEINKGVTATGTIVNMMQPRMVDTRSIVARARNSILQFPVYVTQSIRAHEAHIIAKLFERVYASFVQSVLSQNQFINEDEANNLVFLKKFHSNLTEGAEVLVNKFYEPIDRFDGIMQESIFFSQQLTENCSVEFRVIPTTDIHIIKENTRLLNEPLSGFSYLKEYDDGVRTKTRNNALSEEDIENIVMNEEDLSEDQKRLYRMSDRDIRQEADAKLPEKVNPIYSKRPTSGGGHVTDLDNATEYFAYKRACEKRDREVEDRIKERDDIRNRVKSDMVDFKDKVKDGKIDGMEYRNGQIFRSDLSEIQRGSARDVYKAADAPKLLRDTDIKKINGMLPYSIEATFRVRKDGSQVDTEVRYIIGIKTVLHPINVSDLSDDLREIVTGNIKSLRKVKYKTGEISFKDYMFNLSGIKKDAAKHINRDKRWVNTLKRLADYQSMYGSYLKGPLTGISKGDIPIPNGTLILTQSDVSILKGETGIDIGSLNDAARLCRNLFLITIAIIDPSVGTMKVYSPDNDTDWDVQSLATVETELNKTDNSQLMKELNKLVNK